jgi:L-rhamnose mutarotase
MKRYCLTLDLKNDPQLIAEYEAQHRAVWPEVMASIKDAGIVSMEIYRFGNRLCMVMETEDGFSFEAKAAADAHNEKVQAWESLMWKFQQPLPGVPEGTKWVLMEKIFDLNRS